MIKVLITLVEVFFMIAMFLLVLNWTTSAMAYYQQSTDSAIQLMNDLENNIPKNYTNPYYTVPENLIRKD